MTSAAPPDRPARSTGKAPRRDRIVRSVARVIARCFFRSVEVTGPRRDDGPVIVAASHLNGFVDPVLLATALGRLPRFMAKATLWKVLPARPFLALARIIPVHRRQDGDGTTANTSMFSAAVAALAEHATLAIFPEGTTHDRPHLVTLRTGVARIALQAHDAGISGVRLLPVGIAYEDKVALRGRALVEFAEPVDVDTEVERLRAAGDDDQAVVRGLLAVLERRLVSVSPDFATTIDALALNGAAKVAVRDLADDPRRLPPLALSAPLARELARPPPGPRHIVDAMARYQLGLGHTGLGDEDVVRSVGVRALAGRLAVLAVVALVLAPFALAGLLANAVPTAIVVLAGLVPRAPVTKGTIRVLVALLVFPLTWVALAVFDVGGTAIAEVTTAVTFPLTPLLAVFGGDRSGAAATVLVLVAVPLMGLATLAIVTEWGTFRATWRSWRIRLDRRGQLDELRELRRAVVEQVAAVRPSTPAATSPSTSPSERDPGLSRAEAAGPGAPSEGRG